LFNLLYCVRMILHNHLKWHFYYNLNHLHHFLLFIKLLIYLYNHFSLLLFNNSIHSQIIPYCLNPNYHTLIIIYIIFHTKKNIHPHIISLYSFLIIYLFYLFFLSYRISKFLILNLFHFIIYVIHTNLLNLPQTNQNLTYYSLKLMIFIRLQKNNIIHYSLLIM
jgi:hypothetical protein